MSRSVATSLLRAAFCGMLVFLTTPTANSQTGTGNVQGVVRDATAAVVARARVSIEQVATTRKYETTTNDVGFYLFPSLQPGNYTMTVEAPGMQTWQGQVLLETGQTAVVDTQLAVGRAATQQVTVAVSAAPLVTLTDATQNSVMERSRIEELPLNGRYIYALILQATPGVEGSATNPEVNGVVLGGMEYLQDGAVLTGRDEDTQIIVRPPGIDTVQEMRIESSNSSAKVERPATTMLVTKNGTNQVHGALFETARNNGLGVARQRQDGNVPAHLVRNEFGVSLGGPVYLPKLYNGSYISDGTYVYDTGYAFMGVPYTCTRRNPMRMLGPPLTGAVPFRRAGRLEARHGCELDCYPPMADN